jgi:hypothetical protein
MVRISLLLDEQSEKAPWGYAVYLEFGGEGHGHFGVNKSFC